ncbi:MAG: DUF4860 domain-containing protein [Defluviitaleaceae bacterium]|nr:DUF4860 domain-containing protein [Defluviitaleaceae bacterium]
MIKEFKNNSKIDSAFVLMVFLVFAISIFLVLILSASTYSNMNEVSQEGQNERIALSYIRTKIRNADTIGAVSLEDFYGVPSLVISENIEQREFITRIYFYNGWLYEIFHERGIHFYPQDGIRLLEISALSFEEVENGLIQVSTDFGSTLILPRSSAQIESGVLEW